MLQRTIDGLVKAGITEIAVLTNHKEERVKEVVGTGRGRGFHTTFVHQERPLGTADALKSCEEWLKGESSFVVIYGDDYYSTKGITKFVKGLGGSDDQAIAAAEADDPSRFGRLEIGNEIGRAHV